MKYYAVAKGIQPGIYLTWDLAKKQVEGFKGAKYKSFTSKQEAQEFIDQHSSSVDPPNNKYFSNTSTSFTSGSGIKVYTDGSCVNEVGGYGIVVVREDGSTEEHYGRVPISPCTNQKAELYAILTALQVVPEESYIIMTDSKYSIGCLTDWIPNWISNGWRTSNGQPVQNKEIIEKAYQLLSSKNASQKKVTFQHVYGHSGHQYNERADYLANLGRTC